jgi:hypothetical protein
MHVALLGNFHVDYTSETHHKKSLEALGHTVTPLQEGRATSLEILRTAMQSDMFVWVHTHSWQTPGEMSMVEVLDMLNRSNIPTVTYHLDLWFGLKRQQDLEADSFYRHIGHFFTVDKQMADWFNQNTNVKGHYLQAGVFGEECYIDDMIGAPGQDVLFVGSKGYHSEWPYRPGLVNWLRETYGARFVHVGGDGQIPTTRGSKLNLLYANTKVCVGDTLCLNFDYPYYWSDRVYETLGRGGFLIHPYIKGMEEHFDDKKHLVFYEYGNFDQLRQLIDYYLEHEDEREAIRRAGHEHVKNNHTYKHRWEKILAVIQEGR